MFRFYLSLAAKNLLRHKRRTILTALAIAVGIFYFIILDSFLIGFDRDSTANIINFETGDLQVVVEDDEDEDLPELKDLIPDGRGLVRRITDLPAVAAAAPRLLFQAAITTGLEEMPLMGMGVDPAGDVKVFATGGYIKEGRWIKPGEQEIVLGTKVARLLDLALGDTVTVRTQTKTLTFQAIDLTLVGLVATPNPNVNQNQFFLPLDTAQEALAVGDEISMVAVKLHTPSALDEAKTAVGGLPDINRRVVVKTWRESAASFIEMMKAERSYDSAFLLLVMVISVIGVVNAVLLASLERVREIGLLKALGLTEANITWVFVVEGIGLGLLGGLIGTLAAVGLNYYLVEVGLSYREIMGEMMDELGYPMSDRIYGVWNWLTMLWTMLVAVAVSLAASYFPARKAARLDPVEGLRRL